MNQLRSNLYIIIYVMSSELRVHVMDYVAQYCDKTHGHRLRDARLQEVLDLDSLGKNVACAPNLA